MAELKDFSSFDPEQEKAFVPYEAAMRANTARANKLGYSIAGGFFVISALAVVLLYTPCSRFCERPPITCKTDQEISAFKNNCTSACRALEAERGLSIVRQTKNEATGKMEDHTDKIDGTEFVDNLASCAFAGGAGLTCESITKQVIPKGLWCAESK